MVEKLKEVRNVGELEDSQPAMIVTLDLVVEDHEEADDKAGKSDTTQTDENLLADAHPWRMADAQEDWLVIVNYWKRLRSRRLTWSDLRSFGRSAVEEDILRTRTKV